MKPVLKAPRVLVNSTRLLAAVTGLALASTGECDPLFLFLFLGFFAIGTWIERFPALARSMNVVQPALAAVVLVVGFVDFFYLSNSFLLSIAHFLLSIQGLRLLILRTPRENLGSVLLSSLMMLSASTLAVEWTFFLMLFLFLPAVIWTLMVHNVSSEELRSAAWEGKESAAGPLPGEGESVRERTFAWAALAPVLRSSAASAFLVAATCCAIVFMVFPRFNFAGFRGQFLQPVRKTGFSDHVELGKPGRVTPDESVAMRIEIDPADLPKWTGYVRGAALDYFDGTMWRRTPGRLERIYQAGRNEVHVGYLRRFRGERIRQSIYLESMDSSVLFAAPWPVTFRIDRIFLEVDKDGSVQRPNGDGWRLHYVVDSVVTRPYAGDELARAASRFGREGAPPAAPPSQAASPVRDTYALDAGPADDRIARLAREITRGAPDRLSSALGIARYLQSNYEYTLDQGADKFQGPPVEEFLFTRRKGHCEYFASAMCLMLRRLNIPSRVATGFLAHEWNQRGKYFIVRMKDAHAWVEAYIEPYGWVAFDPSPRDARPPPASRWAMQIKEVMDYLNLRWNRYVLSYDLQRQLSFIRGVTSRSRQMSFRVERWTRRMSGLFRWNASWFNRPDGGPRSHVVQAIIRWTPAALILAAVLAVILLAARRRRARPLWIYSELLRRLEAAGGKKSEKETLAAFASRVRPQLGERAGAADLLLNAYHRRRFGPPDSPSPDEDARLRDALNTLRR